MPLSETTVRKAKPTGKQVRLFDSGGLYLEISPKGGKYWRLKYRFAGRERRLALGVYPTVSLRDARNLRDEARLKLAKGIDPGIEKKSQRIASSNPGSFESISREWHSRNGSKWTEKYGEKIIRSLELNIFPWLGAMPINAITPPMLLDVLRRVEDRGAIETAHRVKSTCGQVFRYAIATARCERDPSADLRGALMPPEMSHMASITNPKEIGELMRAIKGYEGAQITRSALQLAPYVFVRPGELRGALWSEINFDDAEWRIGADRMKLRRVHIVPLSKQALAILRELHPCTGDGDFIFPSERTRGRPMSENTVNAALRRLGYGKDEMTGHGFRSMASTRLNEAGWNIDAIERQLAHVEGNTVRAAYNYAQHLDERAEMMQWWADYLDALRDKKSAPKRK